MVHEDSTLSLVPACKIYYAKGNNKVKEKTKVKESTKEKPLLIHSVVVGGSVSQWMSPPSAQLDWVVGREGGGRICI